MGAASPYPLMVGAALPHPLKVGLWASLMAINDGFQNFEILELQISSKKIPQFYQGCSLIFLDLIQVILSNKMKKYGLPGPKP